MVTDSLRLRQVLKNLLANALKFTEHGTVTLRLAPAHGGWSPDAQRLADADAVIAISVVDTGIGIARDLHSTIFEAFAQADGATARRYGGTGLGLAISRDLVGLLGGEITLTSVVGAGSTFTVLLPLDARAATAVADVPAAVAVAPVTSPAPRGGAGSSYNGVFDGATVLIVDDDFRNIFALTALLERGGLTVLAAQSGPAALAILDEQSEVIDLVLMDIMMPVMNGYETMTAMRARPGLANLPIIAVTGKVVGGERERCIGAGASDYIPKPVDTAELLVALTRWFPAAVAGDTAETVA
jgi:CheY-like chemotaxis protein